MSKIRTACLPSCVALALSAASGTAHAGPVEMFNDIVMTSGDSKHVVLPYTYGGNGMFISTDAKKYGLLCNAAVDPSMINDSMTVYQGESGIYLGLFEGLWRGDRAGCGWTAVPEMDKHFIGAIAGDPIDAKRVYVATSDRDPNPNGIYLDDGAGKFTMFGTHTPIFVQTLHVVKKGEARVFYETGVKNDPMTNVTTYYVRVSTDDAKTWTDNAIALDDFAPKVMYPDFTVVAVDPLNPDHVLGRITRDQQLDSLIHSTDQGKTWKVLAEVNDLVAVTFTPEGVLYYGDNDQNSKRLFVIEKDGAEPKQLSDKWKVGCLRYDASSKTLYGCSNFLFGTVDSTSGELTPLLDMRCAENYVDCPGAKPGKELCAGQLYPNNFCNFTHFPASPVCSGFDNSPETTEFLKSQIGYSCEGGFAKSWTNGEPPAPTGTPDMNGVPGTPSTSAGASAAGAGGSSVAGTTGAAGAAGAAPTGTTGGSSGSAPSTGGNAGTAPSTPAPAKKSSGCSVLQPSAADSSDAAAGLWTLFALGACTRLRRRRD